MTEYLFLFAVVFAINLLPAFGPPTWSVIVMFGLSTDLPVPGIVLVGALAAALGRFLLAHGFRLLSFRVSEETKVNLAAARSAFMRKKRHGWAALGLFALSPVPSAQLFAAIGLTNIRILPFTLAFFAGRLVSYSIYAGSAHLMAEELTLADTFREALTSPWGIAFQIAMLAMLVALAKIPWARILGPADEEQEEG